MSARRLLEQLLQSGQGLTQNASSRVQDAAAGDNAPSFLAGLGSGAVGAGVLGLLLGNKKARKLGGKVALYGGMAALGALAYRAYGDWQRKQLTTPASPPQTLDRLPPAQAEQHSNAVLVAMIGAAKADGHIGPEETQLLETEMAKLSSEPADRHWLQAEIARPLDPAAVARAAQTPEMAAEMYLASLLVVDDDNFMERAYLDELARQLKLPTGLKTQLEDQIKLDA